MWGVLALLVRSFLERRRELQAQAHKPAVRMQGVQIAAEESVAYIGVGRTAAAAAQTAEGVAEAHIEVAEAHIAAAEAHIAAAAVEERTAAAAAEAHIEAAAAEGHIEVEELVHTVFADAEQARTAVVEVQVQALAQALAQEPGLEQEQQQDEVLLVGVASPQ